MATTTNNGWTIPAATDYVKDGYAAIDTLGNAIDTSVGKGLIAWQTYAPTLSGGWANGNGTWSAYYCQIGKTVHVRAYFILGSTTTKGTTMDISLPVTARDTVGMLGDAYVSVGGTLYKALNSLNSTSNARIYIANASTTYATFTNVTSAIPGTWATSDWVRLQMTYEAA